MSENPDPSTSWTCLVMGVSGSGKSTLARALADRMAADYVEADGFHPPANVAKMEAGVPLDDTDRMPWLEALHAHLKAGAAQGLPQVLACSALKEHYRDVLRAGLPDWRVVLLHGDPAVLQARLVARSGHFMPATLLDSQLTTLEEPAEAVRVDLGLSIDEALEFIAEEWRKRYC